MAARVVLTRWAGGRCNNRPVLFDLRAVAAACGGSTTEPDVAVVGAGIDSRNLEAGALFVAVVAERDGHDFIDAAKDRGASAALVNAGDGSRAWPLPTVAVADTTRALADLGRRARKDLNGPVIGITGSVGKTTTKDLCGSILSLRGPCAISARSFNNELGVPLTLINAPQDAVASVIEMGARGEGHIHMLCEIARPTIGVVTNVVGAHLEMFGSIEAIAEAKGELVQSLDAAGHAVLNAEVPAVWGMRARTAAEVIGFGKGGEVRAKNVVVDDELRASFVLRTPWGDAAVALGVAGRHNVSNALAAAAAALVAGASLDEVVAGLTAPAMSPMRMTLHQLAGGARVLDDSYNANPTSMSAALDALCTMDATRRVAVLGVMAELGDDEHEAHVEIARQATAAGVHVVAVGTDLYGTEPVAVGDVAARLGRLGAGDAVLVKGSRVAALERVVASLLAD